MYISQLQANLSNLLKLNQARFILQILSGLFLVTVICGQVFADEKLSLLKAAKDGNQEQVALLINNGADVNQTDDSGYTPLMWAARYGHFEIAERLVNAGALIGLKNHNDVNAIQIASRYDSFEIAQYLEDTYSPIKEKLVNIKKEQPDLPYGDYDKNQDGYLDPVITEKQLSKKLEFRIKEALPYCAQGKPYKVISARWALNRFKWRNHAVVNNTAISAKRKGYIIEMNFFSENNQEIMGVRYIKKQGRTKILERISKQTLSMYQFLCAVPEISDKLSFDDLAFENQMLFQIKGCIDKRYTAIAIALIGLHEKSWKNIRVENGRYVSAHYRTNKLYSRVLIEFTDDWSEGSIIMSDPEESDNDGSIGSIEIPLSKIRRYLNKYQASLYKRISGLHKLLCEK